MKKDNPDIKISKSKFYKVCPKYYKKAHKKTDMCPLCVKGEELKKKQTEKKLKGQRKKMQSQMFLYEQHKRMADVQRTLFSKEIQNLKSKSWDLAIR